MKIAVVHPDTPGRKGTGATPSTTRIGRLPEDLGYDVVTYNLVPGDGPPDGGERARLDLGGLPFPTATALNVRLEERAGELAEMDVVHSYLPRSLPVMHRIGRAVPASIVVILNRTR